VGEGGYIGNLVGGGVEKKNGWGRRKRGDGGGGGVLEAGVIWYKNFFLIFGTLRLFMMTIYFSLLM